MNALKCSMRRSRFRRNPKALETQRRRDAEIAKDRKRWWRISRTSKISLLAAQKSTQYASRQGHRQKSSRNAKDHEHCEGARRRAIAETTPAIRSPAQIPSASFSFVQLPFGPVAPAGFQAPTFTEPLSAPFSRDQPPSESTPDAPEGVHTLPCALFRRTDRPRSGPAFLWLRRRGAVHGTDRKLPAQNRRGNRLEF